MSSCRANQTFYLVVLAVTLGCIIIPSGAREASPHHDNNSTRNEDYNKDHSSENEFGHSVAAFLGVCVGATAGWFSEVIIGVLTAPTNDELTELENKRRVAKLKKRAATLANLKARNGGRIPEEIYERLGSNSRMTLSQRGMLDGYGSDYRKNYSARGRAKESVFNHQEE
ncbi:16648_t:CDS:2 [Acaulospora colombiana]|uniref:16648_t:CDS:1 n=1 Tax=Acaulospora colombiana TaxID=27376 RepID=A0ACA9JY08_9GLOM|nr:16648_t:CDS:2 [Acaulospora colombiana]